MIGRSGRPYSRRMTGIDTERRVPRGRRGNLARRLDSGYRPTDGMFTPRPVPTPVFLLFPSSSWQTRAPRARRRARRRPRRKYRPNERAECRRNRPTELETFVDRQSIRGSFSREKREREREREIKKRGSDGSSSKKKTEHRARTFALKCLL